MIKAILLPILALALAVLSAQIARAQGTVYISSLGPPSAGSASVGSDSWLAAGFGTGTNAGGYLLNSVQLALTNALGNPSGFTAMIYNEVGGKAPTPGSSLGTLSGSLDPVANGIYTYSPASSLTLLPNTAYFIVLTAGTPVTNGAYEWGFTSSSPPLSSDGWHEEAGFTSSSDGLHWLGFTAASAQFAIYATDVPEPSTLALLALGGFFLIRHRRK